MSNYLIVDSNPKLAERLHQVLTNNTVIKYEEGIEDENINYWNCSNFSDLRDLSDKVQAKADNSQIILINAESKLEGGLIQDQELVELAFWFRCKYELKNAIVFYSLQSANHLLKTKPKNFILLSPGCYHLRLPATKDQIKKIAGFKPLENLNLIKPFLKPRMNLEVTRHRYANYTGIYLMALLAQEVWNPNEDIITADNKLYDKLYDFFQSLDYNLLKFYFDLSFNNLGSAQFNSFGIRCLSEKNILLIDDLEAGWKPIISQIIYGNKNDLKLNSVEIKYKLVNNKTKLDFESTKSLLNYNLKHYKPHLILLDLRLNDEEDKRDVTTLGGYKLLRFLKTNSYYKGLPVIMFTASSNAETTKKLIEAGAEAVWTKPGMDESLSTEQIIKRYQLLTRYIDNELFKFDEKVKVESKQDIEETRLMVLQKVEFLKYRAKLSNLRKSDHYFNEFTDIVVDTNSILENESTISNVFKLAQICGETKHKIEVEEVVFDTCIPKIVLHNYVIDELIHWSKAIDPFKPVFWKAGLLAYDVIRGLFQDNLVRTEFNSFSKGSNTPLCLLGRTGLSSFADPKLVKYILSIVSGSSFKLERRFRQGKDWRTESKNAKYLTYSSKVLLITNESENIEGKIPLELRTKYAELDSPQGTIEVINTATFIRKMEEISL